MYAHTKGIVITLSTLRKKMAAVHFTTIPTRHIWNDIFDGSRSYTNSIVLVDFE